MLNDVLMILKIGDYILGEEPDFGAKEVHYHTMNVQGNNYMKKINPLISMILHWKGFLVT